MACSFEENSTWPNPRGRPSSWVSVQNKCKWNHTNAHCRTRTQRILTLCTSPNSPKSSCSSSRVALQGRFPTNNELLGGLDWSEWPRCVVGVPENDRRGVALGTTSWEDLNDRDAGRTVKARRVDAMEPVSRVDEKRRERACERMRVENILWRATERDVDVIKYSSTWLGSFTKIFIRLKNIVSRVESFDRFKITLKLSRTDSMKKKK